MEIEIPNESEATGTSPNVERDGVIAVLTSGVRPVPARNWPDLPNIGSPGMYGWWLTADAVRIVEETLPGEEFNWGRPRSVNNVALSLAYVGLAGATRRSGGSPRATTVTIGDRIGTRHLGLNTAYSTWRHTLAGMMRDQLGLLVAAKPRQLDAASERNLREWMFQNLWITTCAVENRDELAKLERQVLRVLGPPLNLRDVPKSKLRDQIRRLRRRIRPL